MEAIKTEQKIANKEFYEKGKTVSGPNKGNSTFYFYNTSTVAYGKNEFRKIWGERKLEDNWRLSSKQTSLINNDIEVAVVAPIEESEIYKPQTYIARIPTDEKAIDSLAKDRNFAIINWD